MTAEAITDQEAMQAALDEARLAAEAGEVPIGAIVVHQGKVIGRGQNSLLRNLDPTAHAEIIAMRDAAKAIGNYRLIGCTLYVTLEPCAMCAGALVNARVERLIFAAYDPKAGFCGSLGNLVQDARLNHRLEIETGLMEERSKEMLQSFFRQLRERNRGTERWQSG